MTYTCTDCGATKIESIPKVEPESDDIISISVSGTQVVRGDEIIWTVVTSDKVMRLKFKGVCDGNESTNYFKRTTFQNNTSSDKVYIVENPDGSIT